VIEVRCNVIGDKVHWSVGRSVVDETVEDVVRLVFSTAGFASFSERDAYEVIRSALRREKIAWVQPSLDTWRFELKGLSAVIGQPKIVPWLQGSVSIKPEFKYRTIPIKVPPVSSGAFVFYISADNTSELTRMEKTETPFRDEGFICYSHADEKWLKRVRVHLRPLERRRVFKLFDDSQIQPGTHWKDEIKAALDRARVAILLVSADFLASDFIAENELPPLLKKAQRGGATIIPVIVSPCGFLRETKLADYQSVNDPTKPLEGMTYGESEQMLVRLSEAVEEALGNSESRNHVGPVETAASTPPAAASTKVAKGDYPYGIPVPGKPHLVESPYSPGKYIDVEGFPPGTEVKDPYTDKIFLVP